MMCANSWLRNDLLIVSLRVWSWCVIRMIPQMREVTCISISEDSKYALINSTPNVSSKAFDFRDEETSMWSYQSQNVLICLLLGSGWMKKEIHLYSLEAHCLIRRYRGQKQGEFIIRSCFGGLDRNFILSGSEDSKIYVWHKETGVLMEVLEGHGEGSVNAVAWNPRHPTMFASASDDHTVCTSSPFDWLWQIPVLFESKKNSPSVLCVCTCTYVYLCTCACETGSDMASSQSRSSDVASGSEEMIVRRRIGKGVFECMIDLVYR